MYDKIEIFTKNVCGEVAAVGIIFLSKNTKRAFIIFVVGGVLLIKKCVCVIIFAQKLN